MQAIVRIRRPGNEKEKHQMVNLKRQTCVDEIEKCSKEAEGCCRKGVDEETGE